jgi:predicted O-methyltransferase YrrM
MSGEREGTPTAGRAGDLEWSPTSGQVGIIRWVDNEARRHRLSLGAVPREAASRMLWELGAALDSDPGDGVEIWLDEVGRLMTREYTPQRSRVSALDVVRWVGAPLAWRGFGRVTSRTRSVARRTLEAFRHTVLTGVDQLPPPLRPPDGWLYRSPGDARIPIFSAIHPVTGDQLVTRDRSEPRELGYGVPALIGYGLASAPATGVLARRFRGGVAWGARFGEAVTGAEDPVRPKSAIEMPGPGPTETPSAAPLLFPVGHFYSPMYDVREIDRRRAWIWPAQARPVLGIDWRERDQLELCHHVFCRQIPLDFPVDAPTDPTEYWAGNDQFPPLDACVLSAMLRHYKPARMIEVGSGYSSLVAARVNRTDLAGGCMVTCIEPYPRQFLVDGVDGIADLRVELIQDTPFEIFEPLTDRDILFVDTSHTVKTGGDVTWIFNEIIPRLRPGVLVHVHDIFLPGDYPREWVMEGRGWTETYLVRAFLSYNKAFEIVWSMQFMLQNHPLTIAKAFPAAAMTPYGGSLWFRRSGDCRTAT